jgi:hypothetical protein
MEIPCACKKVFSLFGNLNYQPAPSSFNDLWDIPGRAAAVVCSFDRVASASAPALRRGLAFEGFEEEKEDSQ